MVYSLYLTLKIESNLLTSSLPKPKQCNLTTSKYIREETELGREEKAVERYSAALQLTSPPPSILGLSHTTCISLIPPWSSLCSSWCPADVPPDTHPALELSHPSSAQATLRTPAQLNHRPTDLLFCFTVGSIDLHTLGRDYTPYCRGGFYCLKQKVYCVFSKPLLLLLSNSRLLSGLLHYPPLTPKITRFSNRLIPNKDADNHKQKWVRQRLCLYLRKYCSACSLQLFTLAFLWNPQDGSFVYTFFYLKRPCSLLPFAFENASNWEYPLPKNTRCLDTVPFTEASTWQR